MKISVSSYSFSQYIREGKMTLLDTVSKAHEIGLSAIEFITIYPDKTLEERIAGAEKIRAEAEKYDMTINAYTVGANMFAEGDDFQKEFDRLKDELQIAKALGAPIMRHDASFEKPGTGKKAKSFDLMLPIMAKNIIAVTEYSKTLGIKTCIENHGQTCQDSDRIERLYNAVNNDNFGILVDMGNFTCTDENPALAVSRVAPYAIHAHAKDMIIFQGTGPHPGSNVITTRAGNWLRCTIIGQGSVPIKQCIRALKQAGYDGYLSIEFEGVEDCIYGITTGYKNLTRYISEVMSE
ncbi:MAG: sugar phosphate isomerase/epimerase [Bacillota bacterium]|nr:sugar phosphate isomerase/epimerase [Bacillota bacterium]